MLTRATILAAKDLKLKKVDVPEWGGFVYVKSMTSKHRDKFELLVTGKNLEGIRAILIAWCVCDQDGNNLFTDQDVDELNEKSASATQRIFDICYQMANFSESDMEELQKKP